MRGVRVLKLEIPWPVDGLKKLTAGWCLDENEKTNKVVLTEVFFCHKKKWVRGFNQLLQIKYSLCSRYWSVHLNLTPVRRCGCSLYHAAIQNKRPVQLVDNRDVWS